MLVVGRMFEIVWYCRRINISFPFHLLRTNKKILTAVIGLFILNILKYPERKCGDLKELL